MCGQTSFVLDVTELVVGLYEDIAGIVINVIRIYCLFCLEKNQFAIITPQLRVMGECLNFVVNVIKCY